MDAQVSENSIYNKIQSPWGSSFFVFSEWDHIVRSAGMTIGKCMYVRQEDCPCKYRESLPQKKIGSEIYLNTAYRVHEGRASLPRTDREIAGIASSLLHLPAVPKVRNERKGLGIFEGILSAFPAEWVKRTYEPRESLRTAMRENEDVLRVANEIFKAFSIDIEHLGLTGSAALGASIFSDFDMVFYGTADSLWDVKERIEWNRMKNGEVIEHGLNWPCRYYSKEGDIVCCFFNYADSDYLSDLKCGKVLSKDKKHFRGTVTDDRYSLSKTPCLALRGSEYNSLIILNSGFKGTFRVGDEIEGVGYALERADGARMRKIIVCEDPCNEIENWKLFFR